MSVTSINRTNEYRIYVYALDEMKAQWKWQLARGPFNAEVVAISGDTFKTRIIAMRAAEKMYPRFQVSFVK